MHRSQEDLRLFGGGLNLSVNNQSANMTMFNSTQKLQNFRPNETAKMDISKYMTISANPKKQMTPAQIDHSLPHNITELNPPRK